MSDPTALFRQGRWVFSLGLGGVTLAAIVPWIVLQGDASPGPLLLFFLIVPAGSMAAGAFGAYTLTRWGENGGALRRLLRVGTLTLIAPPIACLIAALVLALATNPFAISIFLLTLVGGTRMFALPALAMTVVWSFVHVFVVRPWLSRQATV